MKKTSLIILFLLSTLIISIDADAFYIGYTFAQNSCVIADDSKEYKSTQGYLYLTDPVNHVYNSLSELNNDLQYLHFDGVNSIYFNVLYSDVPTSYPCTVKMSFNSRIYVVFATGTPLPPVTVWFVPLGVGTTVGSNTLQKAMSSNTVAVNKNTSVLNNYSSGVKLNLNDKNSSGPISFVIGIVCASMFVIVSKMRYS